MPQNVRWEPVFIDGEMPLVARIYTLFLLVTVAITAIKIIALWIAAPPFRLSSQTGNQPYLNRLRGTRNSLNQWMGCVLLGWGIVASDILYRATHFSLEQTVTTTLYIWLREISPTLNVALMAALLIFLVRWHIQSRIERLTLMITDKMLDHFMHTRI